jgi:hypothetical protein
MNFLSYVQKLYKSIKVVKRKTVCIPSRRSRTGDPRDPNPSRCRPYPPLPPAAPPPELVRPVDGGGVAFLPLP